jgi:hypothetical protein
VAGEDVEDDRGAVDDRDAVELGLEVALLARRELVVDGDDVRVGLLERRLELLELARPEIGVGVRALAVLDELTTEAPAAPRGRRRRGARRSGRHAAGRDRQIPWWHRSLTARCVHSCDPSTVQCSSGTDGNP